MIKIIQALIVLILVCITWQDFKYRAVYWFYFPILIFLFMAQNFYSHTFSIESNLINLGIVTLQISILHIYYFIKNNNWLLHQSYLGWGDVLFFVVLTFIFPPLTFLAFQLFSLILTLLWFLIFKGYMEKQKGIPLAGCQSVLLILVLVVDLTSDTRILNIDDYIIKNLNNIYA